MNQNRKMFRLLIFASVFCALLLISVVEVQGNSVRLILTFELAKLTIFFSAQNDFAPIPAVSVVAHATTVITSMSQLNVAAVVIGAAEAATSAQLNAAAAPFVQQSATRDRDLFGFN